MLFAEFAAEFFHRIFGVHFFHDARLGGSADAVTGFVVGVDFFALIVGSEKPLRFLFGSVCGYDITGIM
jgi:hypothetical protein